MGLALVDGGFFEVPARVFSPQYLQKSKDWQENEYREPGALARTSGARGG